MDGSSRFDVPSVGKNSKTFCHLRLFAQFVITQFAHLEKNGLIENNKIVNLGIIRPDKLVYNFGTNCPMNKGIFLEQISSFLHLEKRLNEKRWYLKTENDKRSKEQGYFLVKTLN